MIDIEIKNIIKLKHDEVKASSDILIDMNSKQLIISDDL